MAKVTAPFTISGTIDSLNFMATTEGNFVREATDKKMTSQQFRDNPNYDPIRNHGIEMGYAAKKSVVFRQLAEQFYKQSKDVSFVGRANKIMLEILEEDLLNHRGQRTFEQGIQSPFLHEILVGFEGNKNRPLPTVLKTDYRLILEAQSVEIPNFTPEHHLDWPEEATHVHIAMATAFWDPINNTFDTCYSAEVQLAKESETQTIRMNSGIPLGNSLSLTFLFLGFAKKQRRKYLLLHRRNNTVTIIDCQLPPKQSPH